MSEGAERNVQFRRNKVYLMEKKIFVEVLLPNLGTGVRCEVRSWLVWFEILTLSTNSQNFVVL